MKNIRRFVIWLLILTILGLAGLSVYVHYQGKNFLVGTLRKTFGPATYIGEINFYPPFGLHVQGLQLGDFLSSQSVIFQIAPLSLFGDRMTFYKVDLVGTRVVIDRSQQPAPTETPPADGVGTPSTTTEVSKEISVEQPVKGGVSKTVNKIFDVRRLVIREGALLYKDAPQDGDFSFELNYVRIDARNLVFPFESKQTRFRLSGVLKEGSTPVGGSRVDGHGWIDVVKKDLNAEVQIIDPEGKPAMEVMAVSLNNDMSVNGHVKLGNFLKGVSSKKPADEKSVNDLLLNAFSSMGVEVDADFSFRTKMDDFQVRDIGISGNINAGKFFPPSDEKK